MPRFSKRGGMVGAYIFMRLVYKNMSAEAGRDDRNANTEKEVI